MITEISLSQRDKFCMIPLLEISKTVKFIETGSSGFQRAEGRGKWGAVVQGYRVPVL